MGGIHCIKRLQKKRPIAMADPKMTVNDCKVLLAHPNPKVAQKVAAEFAGFLAHVTTRARCVTIADMYSAHFALIEKVRAGEKLIEEKNEP